FGAVLTGLSFLVLNMTNWSGILIVGMIFMTIGEMIAFPFSNAYALDRSKGGKQGEYMAFFAITFSIGHILGHNLGMQMVDALGYDNTWYINTALMGISSATLWWLMLKIKKNP